MCRGGSVPRKDMPCASAQENKETERGDERAAAATNDERKQESIEQSGVGDG